MKLPWLKKSIKKMWCMSSRLKSVTELFWLHWDFFFFAVNFFVQVFCINYYGSNYLMCCLKFVFFSMLIHKRWFWNKEWNEEKKNTAIDEYISFWVFFEIYWWFFCLCLEPYCILEIKLKVKVGHVLNVTKCQSYIL